VDRSTDQLPDLAQDKVTLVWDFVEGNSDSASTTIRLGDRVVWAEPAVWEGAERFAEVVAILKQKYGDQLIDVEPTKASGFYLFGDRLTSFDRVNEVRRHLR
jgi:hypothetical protein